MSVSAPPAASASSPVAVGNARPRVSGKFLSVGEQTQYIRGVTYGGFRPHAEGIPFPAPSIVEADFAQMAANGVNAVRTYDVPPMWLLDAASHHGLHVMVGLPWEQHVTFLDDRRRATSIIERVRSGVRACAGHGAVLCYLIGNEIPATIARWHGCRRIERFLERLYRVAKSEDPEGLVTYVNFPSTEYLHLPFLDLVCFNVYLESEKTLESYLARLQNIAGDRPLLMTEIGLDSRRHGEAGQACVLDWQVRSAFEAGCAGAFVFAWTDEWHTGGEDVEDWDFGLVRRNREPKPALPRLRKAFAETPFPTDVSWPRISVVVCTYNGAGTIRDCLEGLLQLDYTNFEVIIVDDGSTDATATIAGAYPFRLIRTENRGLSSARNAGLEAATGEIVAYTDDDARPDRHWLRYLALTFLRTEHAGVGGPNLAPAGDGPVADCVANAPGGPLHVLLSDTTAEHIPGCNCAFRRASLLAIGGFDPQFRVAGDDVDVCWRIQEHGWSVGFSPAAFVWHHRRNSIRAFWRQQRGYGRAEALLERKWPQRYNAAGQLGWSGRLYGSGAPRRLGWARERVHYGAGGGALFQSVYEPAPSSLWALSRMPEWYLIILGLAGLTVLGVLWRALFLAALPLSLAVAIPLLQAVLCAVNATFPSRRESLLERWELRSVTALLHLMQPLARLCGRLGSGLSPWRRRGALGFSLPIPQTLTLWSEHWRAVEHWLHACEDVLRSDGAVVLRGGESDRWDLAVRGGILGSARVRLAIEEHGRGNQLLRLRLWPRVSIPGVALTVILLSLAVVGIREGAIIAAAIIGTFALGLMADAFCTCASSTAAVRRAARTLAETMR